MAVSLFKPYDAVEEAGQMVLAKGLSPATVEQFGLCYLPESASGLIDLLWCRMLLPIHDMSGHHIAWAGRRLDTQASTLAKAYSAKYLDEQLRDARVQKWKSSKWVNTPYEKSLNLFNIHRAYDSAIDKGYVILVEGYFDAMAICQKGGNNVVASCGTALSPVHARMIKSLCDVCFVMYDPDEAGTTASVKAREALAVAGVDGKVITLPEMLDPDDFISRKDYAAFDRYLAGMIGTSVAQIELT